MPPLLITLDTSLQKQWLGDQLQQDIHLPDPYFFCISRNQISKLLLSCTKIPISTFCSTLSRIIQGCIKRMAEVLKSHLLYLSIPFSLQWMSCALCKITNTTYMLCQSQITHNATFPEKRFMWWIIVQNLATKVMDTIHFPVRESPTGKWDFYLHDILVKEFA